MKCHTCRRPIPSGYYCDLCSHMRIERGMVCVVCGEVLPPNARCYCDYCVVVNRALVRQRYNDRWREAKRLRREKAAA